MNPPSFLTNEQKAEWEYVYTERLGISCEDREPTEGEKRRAREEANRSVKSLQSSSK